jgi:two-component system, OmpR family, sensor histidine kinase VicK
VVTRLELYSRIRLQEQAQRQRQRTERALAIERCFVAATLDSIPALVAVLDTAGRVVRMNDPCAQLTGLSLAMPSGGRLWRSFWRKDDRAWAAGKLRDAAGAGSRTARDGVARAGGRRGA